jgi:hypothetical protein
MVTAAAVLCFLAIQGGLHAFAIGVCVVVFLALLGGIIVALFVGAMHLEADVTQCCLVGGAVGALVGAELGRAYGAMLGGLVGAFVGDAIRDIRARRQEAQPEQQRWWQKPRQPSRLTATLAFVTLLCTVLLALCLLASRSSVYMPAHLVRDYITHMRQSAGPTGLHVDEGPPPREFLYVFALLVICAWDCSLSHARSQSPASIGRRLARASAANGLALIVLALYAVTAFMQGFVLICPPVYGPNDIVPICFAIWSQTIAVTQWPLLLCLALALITGGHLLWSRGRHGWMLAVGVLSVLVVGMFYCGAPYVCKYAVQYFVSPVPAS